MKTVPCSLKQELEELKYGPYQSNREHADFLCGKIDDMLHKGQWIMVIAHMVLHDKNLILSPLGILSQ
jgi:hypothetical protein